MYTYIHICISYTVTVYIYAYFVSVVFYEKDRCFHLSPGSGLGKPSCWCQRAKRPMQSLKNLRSFWKKMTSLLILEMMVSYPRDETDAILMNFGAHTRYESLLGIASEGKG